MGAIEYKMFIDGSSATQEQLDKIDEITVDQAVDRAWEARIKIPVCVNNDGSWDGEREPWMTPFTAIRIEVNAGNGRFVPLIEGPVVGYDSERSAIPGKSVITVVVHDDSALLNRETAVDVRSATSDSDIATQIFQAAHLTANVDPTPAQPDSITDAAVQRSTPMRYLRSLARRNQDWHAYVLPGSTAGASIGCFKKFPTETDGLPDMILLGKDRNIHSFNVNNRSQNPATVEAATLSVDHGTVMSGSSSFRDATLMGDQPPDQNNSRPATTQLPPGQSDRVDPNEAARGAAAVSGLSLEATGSVEPFCYPAALSPYRCVAVKISDSAYSTVYLITQCTHTLTRSVYTQSFSVKGNAVSAPSGGGATAPQPSAGLSVTFNIQGSIF
jgi:phage protein D